MIDQINSHQVGAIFGTGGSGTTWLSSIIFSPHNIAYRFEKFDRLEKISRNLKEIRKN